MLRTFIQGRGTGKTTKAIGILESNDKAILVTYNGALKQVYGHALKNRIATFADIINDRVELQEYDLAVIDEGYLGQPDILAHVYYKLGKARINTVVYGTIK